MRRSTPPNCPTRQVPVGAPILLTDPTYRVGPVGTSPYSEGMDVDEPTKLRPALSPSRAGDFMNCPLLFRFRTIDKLPEPPDANLVRGTGIHLVLEKLFQRPPAERTLTNAVASIPQAWAELQESRSEAQELFGPGDEAALAEWLASYEPLLEGYFAVEDPTDLIGQTRKEAEVTYTLDGDIPLRGFVDRIDIAPTGEVRIVDYKTGKSPHPRFEDKALFQMKFYALVVWRATGDMPRLLQLLYLKDRKALRYAPTERDLLATENKIRAIWAAIEQARATGNWQPNKSALCGWCAHKAVCPAWGGTPPPLPEATSPIAS